MNYLKLEKCDVCNGVGLRISLWISGCEHHCNQCFNQESWNYKSGHPFDNNTRKIVFNELSKDYINGITVTGGDPLADKNVLDVYNFLHEISISFPDKNIWLYSGYTWEDCKLSDEEIKSLKSDDIRLIRWNTIRLANVFVDGRFIDELKDLRLKFKGSSNQRVINVKKTLSNKDNQIILFCE